jgi:hypothetical protein
MAVKARDLVPARLMRKGVKIVRNQAGEELEQCSVARDDCCAEGPL